MNNQINIKKFPKGINLNIIKTINKKKKESNFFFLFRFKAYNNWILQKLPSWSNLKFNLINYNNIIFYSIPLKNKKNKKKIKKTFNLLNINFTKKKTIASEIILDSISIYTSYKQKLAKYGIIFCSISEAILKYSFLLKKYLGTIVTLNDNYFASLNSSIFSDGSFCYIPKNVHCPLELSSYFYINNIKTGQFERTLIIAEKNSKVNYFEGCTANNSKKNQLHAAVVELLCFQNAKIKYSTIQNWYSGSKKGVGGIYNFVTKKGICLGINSNISWIQLEFGSAITWKYPSCILLGNFSKGNFYSLSLTKNYQQTDTGTKIIHLGKFTESKILSKTINYNFSKNTFRSLVKISSNAYNSKNISQCDSFIFGNFSTAYTYPYIDIQNSTASLEHEAQISKINEDQLFYLMQRGISFEQSIFIFLKNFCKNIFDLLPNDLILEILKFF